MKYIRNNINYNIFAKLVLMLILFVFVINKVDAATISFESHGGPEVDSYDISTDKLGTLPNPTMDGYLFDGWYKEADYLNKVSSKTEVTGDMTLHARWVYNPFPFVYPYHAEDFICTGSTYVNTGVSLYTGPNGDEEGTWDKDYEIGFTIEEYDYTNQLENQSVFMNTKYENQTAGWPGLVVRKAVEKIEITQTIDSGKVQRYITDLTFPMNVKIKRKNKVVYYQVNGGRLYTVQDMSVFTKYFDTPVYFCAGDDGNGGVQRYLKGTISNYYVRMGTYEDLETHTVTYPDGTIKVHGHNEVVELGSNDGPADVENITLTFKPNNGGSNITETKTKTTTHHGFYVGEVHYDSDATLVVDEDKVIEYDNDVDVTGSFDFPADPEKEHYTFNGWFDENDIEYTSYDGEEDLILDARYTGENITIHTPSGDEVVHYGDTYNLGTNDIVKANDNIAEVTFKLHNNESDIIDHVQRVYTPNGWKVGNTTYTDNEDITITEEITIEPDYIDTIEGVSFPSNPTKEGYDFDAWYTAETGGNKVESYVGTNDITLHAQYVEHVPVITTPDGTYSPDENGNFTLGTNNYYKMDLTHTSIYLYPNNGGSTIYRYLRTKYNENGWLIDGVHYDDGETIHVTKDIEVIPDYIETIQYPTFYNPVRTGYTFLGWYTAMVGGDRVTEVTDLNGPSRLNLYGHWQDDSSHGNYKLPINNIEKATEHRATVTFKFNNGRADATAEVQTRYFPNGWLVDGVHHDSNVFIEKDENTVIEPDYIVTRINALFPNTPTKSGYEFVGWYTEDNGQGEHITVLNMDSDLTIYAYYTNDYAYLKGRSGLNIPTWGDECTLRPGTEEEYNYAVDNGLTISNQAKDNSPNPVYMWVNGNDILYYSPAEVIFMDSDAGQIFQNKRFYKIDLSGLNSIKVTTCFNLFVYSYVHEIDLTGWDTSNVTNMREMFAYTADDSLDLSGFNTSKVTTMQGMFSRAMNLRDLDISNFDTRNVRDFGSMFYNAFDYQSQDIVLDLNHFDTSSATSLSGFFANTDSLKEIRMDTWNTSNVTNMAYMFSAFGTSTVIDLSNFDTHNVTDMTKMFYGLYDVKTIYVSPDKWDLSNVTSYDNMFDRAPNLVGQKGTKYNANNVKDKTYAHIDEGTDNPGYLSYRYPEMYTVTVLDESTIVNKGDKYTLPTNKEVSEIPDVDISTVTFKYHDGVTDDTTSTVRNTHMPSGWTINDVHYDDVAQVTVNEDLVAIPDFVEVIAGAEFPEPTREGYTFLGWYDEETGGNKVESYDGENDIILHAQWEATYPTDLDIDSDDITMVVGETHQMLITFIPDGTADELTFDNYDTNVINITSEGLITGLSVGTTTITISTTNTDISKTVNVTVIGDLITSSILDVETKSLARIIIGEEPGVTISDFLDKLDNPREYLEVYDQEDNLISSDDYDSINVSTGLTVKLVIFGSTTDEAKVIVRGDIDEDGIVSVSDEAMLADHILTISLIEDYRFYAADIEEDDLLDVVDDSMITDYILGIINSLNE